MNTRATDEHNAWKFLRLWPIIVTLAVLIGAGYVALDNIGGLKAAAVDLKAMDVRLWDRTRSNRTGITELEKQTGIIEFHLKNVDLILQEQRTDIKEILKAVK